MKRTATVRFRRIFDGKVAFAVVSISAEKARKNSVKGSPGGDSGWPGATPSKAWVRASLSGARSALTFLADHDLLGSHWQVQVDEIGGTVSDTSPDAVECASALATWEALAGDTAAPKVRRNGRFYLEFPRIAHR